MLQFYHPSVLFLSKDKRLAVKILLDNKIAKKNLNPN
jgi:hypothetical protein